MADQHNEGIAMGNPIATDVPDIDEALGWHKDIMQMLIGWHDSTLSAVSPPGPQRSQFAWKDGDEIYIEPGVYFHDGTTRQTVFWDAQITFQLGSGGSNAASDDLGASEWHYIYLDDSAIVTQASPELDADCFLNDTTAPTWSDSKHGWYNGNDRCIFAVLTGDGSTVLEFYHDGGECVYFADFITESSAGTPTSTWTDVDCATSLPGFCTRGCFSFNTTYVDTAAGSRWRTNGQTATNGHPIGYVSSDSQESYTIADAITDSSQIIEVKFSVATAGNKISVFTNGWYFPTGM